MLAINLVAGDGGGRRIESFSNHQGGSSIRHGQGYERGFPGASSNGGFGASSFGDFSSRGSFDTNGLRGSPFGAHPGGNGGVTSSHANHAGQGASSFRNGGSYGGNSLGNSLGNHASGGKNVLNGGRNDGSSFGSAGFAGSSFGASSFGLNNGFGGLPSGRERYGSSSPSTPGFGATSQGIGPLGGGLPDDSLRGRGGFISGGKNSASFAFSANGNGRGSFGGQVSRQGAVFGGSSQRLNGGFSGSHSAGRDGPANGNGGYGGPSTSSFGQLSPNQLGGSTFGGDSSKGAFGSSGHGGISNDLSSTGSYGRSDFQGGSNAGFNGRSQGTTAFNEFSLGSSSRNGVYGNQHTGKGASQGLDQGFQSNRNGGFGENNFSNRGGRYEGNSGNRNGISSFGTQAIDGSFSRSSLGAHENTLGGGPSQFGSGAGRGGYGK